MQSNSFKSQSNFPFSSSPLTYTDYYKFKATTTIYVSKPVQCAHSIDAFSLTPSNPPSYMGIDLQDNMKVRQQFTRGIWDHHHNHIHTNHNNNNKQHCNNFITSSSTTTTSSIDQCDPSLSLGRIHPKNPIAPPGSRRAVVTATHDRPITSFDLKSFIRPESGPRKLSPSSSFTHDKDIKQSPSPPHQVETHPGGTRWNPTQDQIGILETLYKQGMRTPNAQQIEQITTKLSKYGKIEGKNVFYWFQNHKARERQKQKRNILGFSHIPSRIPPTPNVESRTDQLELQTPTKRKCGTWSFDFIVEANGLTSPMSWTAHEYVDHGGEMKTLELFPLHPEIKPDES